ncbi:MAG: GH25 family lysozyme [Sphingomonas sp.]|uniref:GH25 family lysozyme n=1 Tax=Sphingomonas sp. TaxID=28214 RepID=UPI0035698B46
MKRRARRQRGWPGWAWLPLAALVAVTIWWLTRATAGDWHPSTILYPRQGIDVSHYQGRIRWSLLPNAGVDFAYIKATEGGDYRDPTFADNWAGAKAVGIERGAYHFFNRCRPGAEQAANFIHVVPRERGALPPAIDLEFLGNCDDPVSVAAFQHELDVFIRLVELRYRQPVILYLTDEFDRSYQVSKRFDRPLWLRNIMREPRFGARAWTLWQASSFRRLPGIAGRVDWNVQRR